MAPLKKSPLDQGTSSTARGNPTTKWPKGIPKPVIRIRSAPKMSVTTKERLPRVYFVNKTIADKRLEALEKEHNARFQEFMSMADFSSANAFNRDYSRASSVAERKSTFVHMSAREQPFQPVEKAAEAKTVEQKMFELLTELRRQPRTLPPLSSATSDRKRLGLPGAAGDDNLNESQNYVRTCYDSSPPKDTPKKHHNGGVDGCVKQLKLSSKERLPTKNRLDSCKISTPAKSANVVGKPVLKRERKLPELTSVPSTAQMKELRRKFLVRDAKRQLEMSSSSEEEDSRSMLRSGTETESTKNNENYSGF